MDVGDAGRRICQPRWATEILVTCPDGDWTIGFDGFPWHTHGSILAELTRQDEIAAVECFLADLIGNVSVITLKRISGKLVDAWVSDDPVQDRSDCKRYGSTDELIEFRLWNGSRVDI